MNMFFFNLCNRNSISFGLVEPSLYNLWDKEANTRLNTGLLAIFDILNTEAK